MARLILLIVVSAICVSVSQGARPDVKPEVYSNQPGSFCQGCRSIVSFMSRFNSSTRRQENKDLFGRYCELYYPVSTDFRHGPCPIFVEGLFTILDRIDPVYQCDKIGACDSNYLPSGIEAPSSAAGKNNLVVVRDDGPLCKVCVDTVDSVKSMLNDPHLIDNIHRNVEAFCQYLTIVDAEKQCQTALNSYIDQALEFVKKMNSKNFCQSVQLCAATTRRPTTAAVRVTSTSSTIGQEPRTVMPTLADFNDFGLETSGQAGGETINRVGSGSPYCLLCKTVVKELFKILKENRTEANLRYGLDHVCELVYHKGEKRDHCEDLVKAYTKELLELLVDETDPALVCSLIDQCVPLQTRLSPPPAVVTPKPSTLKQASTNNDEKRAVNFGQLISMLDPTIQVNSMRTCVECKLFFKYLQETLQEKKSQQEIEDWLLKNLCNSIGDPNFTKSCTEFINKESAAFFQAIVESLDPKKSCQQLGACSARIRTEYLFQLQKEMATLPKRKSTSGHLPKRSSSAAAAAAPIAKPICDQCVQVVSKIDDYLSTHPIDHDITVLKDKVCNSIQDDNLRGECIMIIQTFGQEIIQAISNMDSPRQLCGKIALC